MNLKKTKRKKNVLGVWGDICIEKEEECLPFRLSQERHVSEVN